LEGPNREKGEKEKTEPLAQAGYCSGYVIDGNVGERAGVLSYGVIDAVALGC